MPQDQHLRQLLPEDLLQKLLSKALQYGGDFAEIYAEQSLSHQITLDDEKIRSASSHNVLGVGIRVFAKQEVGYAYTDDLHPHRLEQTALVAGAIAKEASASQAVAALQQGSHKQYYQVAPLPAAIDLLQKTALLQRGYKAAKSYHSAIQRVSGSFVDNSKHILIANSEGTLQYDTQMMCRLHFSTIASAPHSQEKRSGFYGGGGRVTIDYFESFSPEGIAQEASRMAIAQLGAKQAPAGPQTVVLSPGWSGVLLHEAVGHGLESDFIRKGSSLYTGCIGQQVASPLCTVIDSGILPNKRGSINIDDEGENSQENVLIEGGILRGYMMDKLSARLMKQKTTGNGRRQSYAHTPMPRMTNTYLAPGPHHPEEILASVSSGLYCASLGGGQVDISNGNFVFEVTEGYMIENGKLSYPVQNATLIGIGPEALKEVAMVGNDWALDPGLGICGKDGQSVPVGVGMPTVKIDTLTVGGTHVA